MCLKFWYVTKTNNFGIYSLALEPALFWSIKHPISMAWTFAYPGSNGHIVLHTHIYEGPWLTTHNEQKRLPNMVNMVSRGTAWSSQGQSPTATCLDLLKEPEGDLP